jgi:predicted alpha/beta hydrolase family esterase
MRVADADILIMPGLGDSGPDHWQTRWERKLSTARRIVQQDWDRPRLAEWLGTIEREIAAARRPAVCIAHSLGVAALIHAAPRVSDKIAGAFLVAPPSEHVVSQLPAIDRAFAPYPRSRLPFPTILVASANDPYADADFSRALAQDLGAELVDAGEAGHINVDSGHGPWPEGLLRFAAFVSKL